MTKLDRRNYNLQRLYGINLKQYTQMLKDQNGVCKICGGTNKGKTLHVDHNHKTKRVRGLLCFRCNRGVGYLERFFKDTTIMTNAVEYLYGDRV